MDKLISPTGEEDPASELLDRSLKDDALDRGYVNPPYSLNDETKLTYADAPRISILQIRTAGSQSSILWAVSTHLLPQWRSSPRTGNAGGRCHLSSPD